LCGLQWNDVDFEREVLHVGTSYLVRSGLKVRKDTKTHQDRYLAVDEITVTILRDRLDGGDCPGLG
jgi:integrase